VANEGVGVEALPKAELHCHIDGLLDPALLEEMAAAGHAPPVSPQELGAVWPVTTRDGWESYARVVEPIMTADWLMLAIEHHLWRLRRQNVVYAELMVSRFLAGSAEEAVALFSELRARVEPILEVGLVVCVGRQDAARLDRQIERILPLARAGLICGVAVAGDERACSIRELGPGLRRLRDEGLGIEIHAGETLGAESVEDALDHGAPHRLGHAVAAFSHPHLIERLLRDHIHVELCPTSNLRLGVVRAIEDHPLPIARRHGVSFSINTDDPGPFACTLSSEHALARDSFGFGAADFAEVFTNTMAARFRRP
jgi:adenosine deaminase